MPYTRRRLLALGGTSLLVALFGWWRSRAPTDALPTAFPATELRAWVDTLLPAEEDFPGGVELGVGEALSAAIAGDASYHRLAQEALLWLSARARAAGQNAFAALPAAEREAIVAAAAGSAPGSPPRTFFQATFDDALFHAYADPRAWAGLRYDGPPQPLGFPDYAAPPRER